jgi:hypothetical protein
MISKILFLAQLAPLVWDCSTAEYHGGEHETEITQSTFSDETELNKKSMINFNKSTNNKNSWEITKHSETKHSHLTAYRSKHRLQNKF